jgi:hypothetical protein
MISDCVEILKYKMRIFIDTEFTDLLEPILISIGMVADSGEEFYVEVSYPDAKCTIFVRQEVLPHLRHETNSFCEVTEIRLILQTWIESVRRNDETIFLCFDYQTDWDLFANAIQDVPVWVKPNLCGSDFNKLLLYEYFKKNPGEFKHHALHDARANKYAYRPRDVSMFLNLLAKEPGVN